MKYLFIVFFLFITIDNTYTLPQCRYSCDDPQCDAVCNIVTSSPKCIIQYNNGIISNVIPKCNVICLEINNETNVSEQCPICEIRCEKPFCSPNCHPLCEASEAQWRCEKPKNCPLPRCELTCEKPACESDQTEFDELVNVTVISSSIIYTTTISSISTKNIYNFAVLLFIHMLLLY